MPFDLRPAAAKSSGSTSSTPSNRAVRRWLGGPSRIGELGIWLAALMACAVTSKTPPAAVARNAAGFAVDKEGCLLPPPGLLARWDHRSSKCGTLLIQDSRDPLRVGLLSGQSGTTLAEGSAPEPCARGACKFFSWSSELGPLVVASLHPASSDNPSHFWLGLRRGHHFSFVTLTPNDAQARAGEVVAPRVMLEPWKCGPHLALRRERGARSEGRAELLEREGRYMPDGHGWLVVPDVDWDAEGCERLPLTF